PRGAFRTAWREELDAEQVTWSHDVSGTVQAGRRRTRDGRAGRASCTFAANRDANRPQVSPRPVAETRRPVGPRDVAGAARPLVTIMIGLVRPILRHTDIRGLFGAQPGQVRTDAGQVQTGDFFVQLLGQHIDPVVVV